MASEPPAAGGGVAGEPRLKDIDITDDGHEGADVEDPRGAGTGAGGADSDAGAASAAGAAAAAPAEGGATGAAGLGLDRLDADLESPPAAKGGGGGGGNGGVVSPPPMTRNSPRGTRSRPPEGMLGNPMDGVGEDERAYNYICNLDKVNLGGPGWFNDVFKVSVEVDTDRTWVDTLSLSLVPRNAFRRHCPLLDTAENITGTVTVEGPASKRVWLSGVSVTFEEHLMTVDSDTGELVGALEAQVATGQFIKDKAVFSFNLDLGILDNHRQWPVRETYVGDLMALRHRLMVSAQRPWYTFNVYSQIPLAMECLSRAPDEDAGQDNEEGGPNHVLVISDCNGRCDFDFGVDSFNLDDVLQGTVRFSDVTSPIVAAHLMLLRAEFLYGEASEVLVAEHTILGEGRKEKDPAASGAAGLSEEEQARQQFMSPFVEQKDLHFVRTQEEECRMEAVVGDVDIPVEVPLNTLPLTPSHMSLTQDIAAVNDEAELVGVRYYIRLVLEDNAQQAYWHTHEIFFHRADRTLSSQGLDDISSNGDDVGDGYGYDAEGDLETAAATTSTPAAAAAAAGGYSGGDSNGNRADVAPAEDGDGLGSARKVNGGGGGDEAPTTAAKAAAAATAKATGGISGVSDSDGGGAAAGGPVAAAAAAAGEDSSR